MHKQRTATKRHIELTTLSLLEKRNQWEHLARHLPDGSLLIIAPKDNRQASLPLLKVAQSFRDTRGEVEILSV